MQKGTVKISTLLRDILTVLHHEKKQLEKKKVDLINLTMK